MNMRRKGSLYSKLLNENCAEYSRLRNGKDKRRFAWERVIWPITELGGKFYIRKEIDDDEEDEWVEANYEHVARTVMQALRDRNRAMFNEKATSPTTSTPPPPKPGPDEGRKTPEQPCFVGSNSAPAERSGLDDFELTLSPFVPTNVPVASLTNAAAFLGMAESPPSTGDVGPGSASAALEMAERKVVALESLNDYFRSVIAQLTEQIRQLRSNENT